MISWFSRCCCRFCCCCFWFFLVLFSLRWQVQSSSISIHTKLSWSSGRWREGSAMPPEGGFFYFGHSTNGSSVTRTDVKVSVNHPQQQQQPQYTESTLPFTRKGGAESKIKPTSDNGISEFEAAGMSQKAWGESRQQIHHDKSGDRPESALPLLYSPLFLVFCFLFGFSAILSHWSFAVHLIKKEST